MRSTYGVDLTHIGVLYRLDELRSFCLVWRAAVAVAAADPLFPTLSPLPAPSPKTQKQIK
jgi:hypothetical protein